MQCYTTVGGPKVLYFNTFAKEKKKIASLFHSFVDAYKTMKTAKKYHGDIYQAKIQ